MRWSCPAIRRLRKMFSLKFITAFPDNPQQGLPLIQALVILTDGATGDTSWR